MHKIRQIFGFFRLKRDPATPIANRRSFLFGIILVGVILLLSGGFAFERQLETARKRIAQSETSIRFGAIGDFEYGTRNKVGNKLTSLARPELEKVVRFYNEEWRPAFVVELGDMIESSGVKRAKAFQQFQDIDAVFQSLDARTEYVFGNHDLRSLSKSEVKTALRLEDSHRYFDEGAWRFVIADTNFDKERDGAPMGPHHFVHGFVPESEYVWLEQAIDTDRPVIVFTHHPPIPGEKNLRNFEEFRTFLARFPNVVLTVSGHDPSFKFYEANGFASLVVDNLANRDSLGSFATLDARYNPLTKKARILVEHYGPTRRSITIDKTLPGKRPWWIEAMERLHMNEE